MFRNTRYPALRFYAGGVSHKFIGGRLEVGDAAAEAVRLYAATHPELGIEEVRAAEVAPAAAPEPSPDPLAIENLPYSELQQMCRALGRNPVGSRTSLIARIREG